jgi:leader peptidase (prepilin peptidase)/N-methyltransferase
MTDMPYLNAFLAVYAFAWGAIWGSFLNVVVYRLPRGMSLSHPPSRCPKCSTRIHARDNVPVFGWLLLKGKCRACAAPIPARYPGVELLTGLLGLALWLHLVWHIGASAPIQVVVMQFLLHFFFVANLVAITFIDIDLTIIPHRLTFPGMAWGLLSALLSPKTGPFTSYHPSVDIVDSVIGLAAGGGVILLLFVGYRLFTGREGMGLGDATLLGMIGATLGWQSLLFVLMCSSLQALAVALLIEGFERVTGRSVLLRGVWKDEFWESHPLASPAAPASAPSAESPPDGPTGVGQSQSDVVASSEPDEEDFMKKGLPYGPFLALAAVEYLFFGARFVRWMSGGEF